MQKANLKEEEQLLLQHSTKEIQETSSRETKAAENARLLIQKSQKQKDLHLEIINSEPEALKIVTEEEKQKEAKRKEYERYCKSVEGIIPPIPFEEFLTTHENNNLISSEITLDDLDFLNE